MAETVFSVLQQIFPRDSIISIMIQFPKPTIQYVEMFVGKVFCDFVDIFFFIDLMENGKEVGFTDLTRGDSPGVAEVDGVEDAGYDGDRVFVLEFGVVG